MDLHALVWRMSGLAGARYLGSRLVEGKLQILCYHAFAFADEHRFRGSLFMSPDVFEQRLGWLKKNRYVVLGLAEALARLAAGRIGPREIVITIDDGFHSVHALAAPLLRAHGMTATVYVTSYYVVHQHPVFRLAIQYMAWRSRHDSIEVSSMVPGVEGELPLHGAGAEAALRRFYEAAERLG